jgi:hypothetical protein
VPTRKKEPRRKRQQLAQLQGGNYWTLFWSIVGGIALVLGLAASVVTFLPRLSIEAPPQFDPTTTSPIPFVITNTGFVPLMNVKLGIGICEIGVDLTEFGHPEKCDGSLGFRINQPWWYIKRLGHDEKHVVRLDEILDIQRRVRFAADISIVVIYQPWFLPFQREAEFRFLKKEEKDGKISWLPRPLFK